MTQEEQEEVKLLKELIADKSISADEREIYEDALNQLMKSEKPQATTSESKPTTTQRKKRTTPTKKVAPAKGKKSVDDVEKAKAEIKAKTGKTEAECESIIEQYRALRTKAQEGKRKAEQASADNKERVGKLERKGDIIAGTNEKTADAVIESSAKDVAEKIEKEVEAVEAKAEKEAKAEVAKDKSVTSASDKKEAIEAKVEQKVKEKTQTIVKRVVIDTSALLTSIASSLGKFDKDSQKEFLIKLRSDIDKLISKYAFGGMTDGANQVMDIQQSNMSSSSVNPSQFAYGGNITDADLSYYVYPTKKVKIAYFGKVQLGSYFSLKDAMTEIEMLARSYPANELDKYAIITPDKTFHFGKKEYPIRYAEGGGVGNYNQSWHQDHYRINKGESYEVPASKRKRKYADGGMVGQEIVFDDGGEENTGVIKDIHENTGDYIVSTDDGRTILVQLDRDVISLGGMRKQAPMMEAPRKRFGFFEEGGGVESEYIVKMQNEDSGDIETINVLAKTEDEAIENALNESGLSSDYILYSVNKKYAQGGMTEHGLEIGDEVMGYTKEVNHLHVLNRKNDEWHSIDLDKGKRY